MSKSDAFANDLLKLIFNGTAIADLAENDATSPLTSLYISLHTADPGGVGTQATSEVAYTSYARVAVARNSGGFTVSGSSVTLTAPVDFPEGTGGSGTVTHFSIGVAASGATKVLYKGTVTPNISTGLATVPRMKTGTVITET
jgi:predicted methyltransferase